jgi:hypothetical protein
MTEPRDRDDLRSKGSSDSVEKQILNAVKQVGATEKAIQRELGDLTGEPSSCENELLANLGRLQQSLRGPEELLDRALNSRPFPPAPAKSNGQPVKGP